LLSVNIDSVIRTIDARSPRAASMRCVTRLGHGRPGSRVAPGRGIRGPRRVVVLGSLLVTLTVAACGGGSTGSTASRMSAGDDPTCDALRSYGSFPGRTVKIFSTTLAPEDVPQERSYQTFEKCTGVTIEEEGSNDFEAALLSRIQGGDPPDLAYVPEPGLIAELVAQGAVKKAPKAVETLVDQNWSKQWKAYGTVGGSFYAAPLSAGVTSFVWYSPKEFARDRLALPRTWDELIKVSDKLAARGGQTGYRPWCVGFASGSAGGRPGTDWIEDALLRTAGSATYDRWVTHATRFDDPQVQAAFDKAGQILQNERYVNGGHGRPPTIANTPVQEGAQTILRGQCSLYRQGSSFAAQWPAGTDVSSTGDVYAFLLPSVDPAHGTPIVADGDFVTAFSDRPEVVAVQTYLASAHWVTTRAKLGGWASASTKLNAGDLTDPIQQLSVKLLQDPRTTVRFDASDLMPVAVESAFWKGMLSWIGGRSTAEVTATVEKSWPAG
jgi:alpha-glucoside transport system substrate-binding protein